MSHRVVRLIIAEREYIQNPFTFDVFISLLLHRNHQPYVLLFLASMNMHLLPADSCVFGPHYSFSKAAMN